MKTTSHLVSLRAARALRDIAPLIGFTPKGLAYILHSLPPASRYRAFDIPKKTGGVRRILAPEPRLALAQKRLAGLLLDCMDEIAASEPRRRAVSHGFHRHRSIVTNAREHRRRRYVLNLDLEDFFGSINFGRVRGFFIRDTRFALAPDAATVIAQIVCHENALPQGSPCSPVISNLVGHILDVRLVRLAKANRVRYTRYVDDITLSTNEKTFPPELAVQVGGSRDWGLGDPLVQTISRAGFKANDVKTRMQIRGSRQVVTGLVVNATVNIAAEDYRATRAMCDALFRSGAYHRPDAPLLPLANLAPLEGRLAHASCVKRRRDLETGEAISARKAGTFVQHAGIDRLYRRFLIYKHFVAAAQPTLVTEGKTDVVYLRCAMRALAERFPRLASASLASQPVAFVRSSHVTRAVLKLVGGYSDMVAFVAQYDAALKRYAHAPLAQPAIFVVDNDEGGQKLFGKASIPGGAKVGFDTIPIWHHMKHNLYLLRTPPKTGAMSAKAAMTSMEDLFSPAVLATRLDGKPFDRSKAHGDTTSYGKALFADRVVRPGVGSIDFSGFAPMLEAITEIMDHHAAMVAGPTTATTPTAASGRP